MRSSFIQYLPVPFLFACISLFLAACNLPAGEEATPTELSVTQAYETIQAVLTQSVQTTLSPTVTQTSPTAAATPTTAAATRTPTVALPTASSRLNCDQAAPGNPIDVTIPDDTVLQPNQSFTKVWRLQNSGTCTWSKAYAVAFFSGDQLGAPPSVPLAGDVAPGQSVDITVDLVAPNKAGAYQGNWKLRNASNLLFGIGPGGSAPFWVRIVVAQASTPTVTPRTTTPTTPSSSPATSTPTATATQPVHVVGTANLNLNSTLDLDSDQINAAGADMIYIEAGNGKHQLTAQGSALLGLYGGEQPGQENCQASALGTDPIIVEDTPLGNYVCYRTDQGRYGRARISSFNVDNFTVTLEILTWP